MFAVEFSACCAPRQPYVIPRRTGVKMKRSGFNLLHVDLVRNDGFKNNKNPTTDRWQQKRRKKKKQSTGPTPWDHWGRSEGEGKITPADLAKRFEAVLKQYVEN